MSEYTPDRWQIIKISCPGQDTLFKVLTTWSGGFTWGESWRLNSGITKIEDSGTHYNVHGSSGSIYKLKKWNGGMSGYGGRIYESLKAQIEASGGIVELVGIHETENFLKAQSESKHEGA